MFQHRIQNDQQLPHTSGQHHLLRLARGTQALVERKDDRLKRAATSAAIYSTARICARPPQTVRFPRNVPLSRFSGAPPTNAAICLPVNVPSSGRVASNVVVTTGPTPGVLRKSASFSRHTDSPESHGPSRGPCVPLEPGNVRAQALAHRLAGSPQTALLRRQHLDELPATHQDRRECLGLLIRQGPRLRSHDLGKVRQRLGVQRIGFGEPPSGFGEVAHLSRIDNDDRHPGGGQYPRERDL